MRASLANNDHLWEERACGGICIPAVHFAGNNFSGGGTVVPYTDAAAAAALMHNCCRLQKGLLRCDILPLWWFCCLLVLFLALLSISTCSLVFYG